MVEKKVEIAVGKGHLTLTDENGYKITLKNGFQTQKIRSSLS
jgi:hypothetical protein